MQSSSPSDTRPIIETPRLSIRPVRGEHASIMTDVLSAPALYEFLEQDPPTRSYLERQYTLLESGLSPDGREHWLTWILFKREDGRPIGYIQATVREPESAHVAYVITPSHWRKGYAREALVGMLNCVFSRYAVMTAIAEMDTRNRPSIGLVESLGFEHVRTEHDAAHFKGSASHEHVYQLLGSAWRARCDTEPALEGLPR